MKDYNNDAFYNSVRWRKTAAAYMSSQNYVCERCGAPALICHHREHLDGNNVSDPYTALAFENLEALCLTCHNIEHAGGDHSAVTFDANGNILHVEERADGKAFRAAADQIDAVVENATRQNRI